MSRSILTQSIWDNRRSLIGWIVAATLLAIIYGSFYTQMTPQSVETVPESLRDAFNFSDIGSAAGYLGTAPFGILVPLVVLFYGVATGARAIAGDEENGLLELVLAHPVSRTKLLLQRFGAMAAGAVAIAIMIFLGMLAIRSSADLGSVSAGQFAAQSAAVALLAIFFGALALGIGAAGGRHGLVFAGTATVGVLSYILNAFAPQMGATWLQKISPFYYYIGGEPLKNGFQWGHLGILAALTVVILAISLWLFNRRDLA